MDLSFDIFGGIGVEGLDGSGDGSFAVTEGFLLPDFDLVRQEMGEKGWLWLRLGFGVFEKAPGNSLPLGPLRIYL